MMASLRQFLRSPVIWPLAGLILLLAVNAMLNPGFLKVTMLDGHLFGTPIDILKQGALTLVLALGMTLVIATGGIDLSVGSVMAISGAVAGVLLQNGHALPIALVAALA